jgi:hypothetical protein
VGALRFFFRETGGRFILVAVLVIALASFFQLFVEGGTQLPVVLILSSPILIVVSFILWTAF